MADFPSSLQTAHRIPTRSRIRNDRRWLAIMLCISFNAAACETIGAEWCSGQLLEATPFELTGPELRMLAGELSSTSDQRQRLAIGAPGEPEEPDFPPSCGSVGRHSKSHWQCMSDIVALYCHTLVAIPKGPISAKPLIAGPSAAINDDHHAAYSLDMGVYGSCLICGSVE